MSSRTHNGPTRRRLIAPALGMAGAAGALALGACGGEPAPGADGPPRATLQGTNVEYWNSNAPTHAEEVAKRKVLEAFASQNTLGVKLQFNEVADANAASLDKIITALAAGSPPDLYSTHPFFTSDLHSRGATVDPDAELKGDGEWKKARPRPTPASCRA